MFKLQDTPGVYSPKTVAPIAGTPNESLVVVAEIKKEVVPTVVEKEVVVEDVKTESKIELKRPSKKSKATRSVE